MKKADTLETLVRIEKEMAAEGRAEEVTALRDAVGLVARTLTRSDDGLLTTGNAAERLGVSISTVKRWAERGTLKGVDTGTRWLVTRESVERVLRMRRALAALDKQGDPTPEEFMELRRRRSRGGDADAG